MTLTLKHACIETLSGFYLEKNFFGGEVSYSAMNIIAYYRSTHCVGGLGEYPPENFLIFRCDLDQKSVGCHDQ